jgi:uncharacterized protein YggE
MRIFIHALLLSFALAAGAQASDADSQRRIVVSAQGSAEAPPDMAVVTLTVNREADTARAAVSANSSAMAGVLDELRKLGIEDRDLQTSRFSIQPRYTRPRPGSGPAEAPRLEGYTVRNSLTVRLRDIGRVGELLDAAVALGVNEGGNITFANQDTAPLLRQARERAVGAAMAKADTLATAAGVSLGEVLEVSEQSRVSPPVPVMRAMAAEMASDSVPVAAGENRYTVSVDMIFAIGD